jgi:hypothetical protein
MDVIGYDLVVPAVAAAVAPAPSIFRASGVVRPR